MRIQKLINLKVLIDCEEDFDIQNLAVCIAEEQSKNLIETDRGMIDDFAYLPRTDYCEIVDYLKIEEEAGNDYE